MSAEQDMVLRVEHVSKRLGGKLILDDCSLDVRRGELMVLIGPSGAGKSTLLQCIDCLIPPDTGEIWLEGERLERGDKRKLCAFRAQVGMIFQDFNLFDHLTAEENVAIPATFRRGTPRPYTSPAMRRCLLRRGTPRPYIFGSNRYGKS